MHTLHDPIINHLTTQLPNFYQQNIDTSQYYAKNMQLYIGSERICNNLYAYYISKHCIQKLLWIYFKDFRLEILRMNETAIEDKFSREIEVRWESLATNRFNYKYEAEGVFVYKVRGQRIYYHRIEINYPINRIEFCPLD